MEDEELSEVATPVDEGPVDEGPVEDTPVQSPPDAPVEAPPIVLRPRRREVPHTALGAAATDLPFLMLAAAVAVLGLAGVIFALDYSSRNAAPAAAQATATAAPTSAATEAPTPTPEDGQPRPTPLGEVSVYYVRSGDTLRGISQNFYGTPDEWQRICDANRDQVQNCNVIQPGTRLLIPALQPSPSP